MVLGAPSIRHNLSILTADAEPSLFDKILSDPLFADLEAHPHTGSFGRRYHPAVHGNRDCSFAVCVDGTPALICLCAPLDGKLSFYGMPLRMVASRSLSDDRRQDAMQLAFLHLDQLAKVQGLREVTVLNHRIEYLSDFEEACRARNATMDRHPVASVDLGAGPVAWRNALRKSSRSLINWGRRNLLLAYVNKEQPNIDLFDRFRDFHAEVAGRVTRSVASWNVMYDWIVGGGGELILAFFENRLIAGSMFIDGAEISIYASGVYDRNQFDKPLAHYPLWLGIERAQQRGIKLLELGEVPERGSVSDKEYQIGYFKRGFATHIESNIEWRWPVPHQPSQHAF
jgi:hypothetical protein